MRLYKIIMKLALWFVNTGERLARLSTWMEAYTQ